jgi:hypothetical protein
VREEKLQIMETIPGHDTPAWQEYAVSLQKDDNDLKEDILIRKKAEELVKKLDKLKQTLIQQIYVVKDSTQEGVFSITQSSSAYNVHSHDSQVQSLMENFKQYDINRTLKVEDGMVWKFGDY